MRVVALDFSAAMLAIAQARARRLPAPAVARPGLLPGEPAAGGVSCLQADALRLPLAEASVDLVTISYGLRNLADLEQGLQELWRVLRPGGRLRVLDFGKPPQAIWRALYFAYLRFLVPVLGWLVCGDAQAYAYILRSLQAYPSQPVLAAKLTGLGWINVQVTNLLGGVMGIHSAEKPGSASRSQDPGVAAGAAQARDSRRGGRAGQPGPCGPT
jgi:demethylmenaquinone methyltransferase/2-methoxy-6-polyprenyl-1,4-benzoquinol methylase